MRGRCFGCDQIYEVKEGEPVAVSEIPTFDNFEDMQKFLDAAQAGKSKGDKVVIPGKKARSKRKPVQKDTATALTKANSVADTSLIHKSIHLYTRKGDSFDQVLRDGREEIKYAANSMLIFCHNHEFSQPCSELCRGMN